MEETKEKALIFFAEWVFKLPWNIH
jgi:hypothetical protein